MDDIDYIMITSWADHWDKPKARSTLFRHDYIKTVKLKYGPWPPQARTLFIKVQPETQAFQKSWIGISSNFRKDTYRNDPAVRFDVSDLKVVRCPDAFKNLSIGWYPAIKDKETAETSKPVVSATVEKVSNESPVSLRPFFFSEMETCDWMAFEQYCFLLFRVIGIHDILKYPQTNNRGKADGFFKFESLAVLYDATLENNFESSKDVQLANYINQLRGDKMEVNQQIYTIREATKQVWIITRGSTSRHLRTEDGIKIKEVPFTKLIELYDERLRLDLGRDALTNKLKEI